MKFKTVVSSSKEVLFVGQERGNSRRPEDWVIEAGRWKIHFAVFDQLINTTLEGRSFGASVEHFIFGFDIGHQSGYFSCAHINS